MVTVFVYQIHAESMNLKHNVYYFWFYTKYYTIYQTDYPLKQSVDVMRCQMYSEIKIEKYFATS